MNALYQKYKISLVFLQFIVLSIAFFCLCFIFYSISYAFTATYGLADSNNWNMRFDAVNANDYFPTGGLEVADLDGDGEADIIGAASYTDYGGTDKGSVYIIYNSLFEAVTGSGNTFDLTDPSNWNIRIDATGDIGNLGDWALDVADMNADGKLDLIVGALFSNFNGRTRSGSLFIIDNSTLTQHTGTGNIIDLNDPDNFYLRMDGAGERYTFSFPRTIASDINENGYPDLIVSSMGQLTTTHGYLYVIYDSLISRFSGTGNIVDMADPSNYNLRFSSVIGDYLSNELIVGDVDDDDTPDILVGGRYASNNGRTRSGSFYVIYNSLFRNWLGVGNNIDLTNSNNYNLRFDGDSAGALLGNWNSIRSTYDIDGNGKEDIILPNADASPNSRPYSGSIYLFSDSFISGYSGTGNNIDLANPNNFSLRIDGATGDIAQVNCSRLSYRTVFPLDFNEDNKLDIFAGAIYETQNSIQNSGVTYYFDNSLIDISETGKTLDTLDPANYTLRYDGSMVGEYFPYGTFVINDINGDDKEDLIFGSNYADYNSRTNSGSLFIIYNYPHTILIDSIEEAINENTLTITGSIDASSKSVTDISGVQYSVDSDEFIGTWNDCTPDDGTFDSTLENYTCPLTTELSDGLHTIYIRSYDENGSYTALNRYLENSFTVDTVSPSRPYLIDPRDEVESRTPTLVFERASDELSGVNYYTVYLDEDNDEGYEEYRISHLPAEYSGIYRDDDEVKVVYEGDRIRVYFKELGDHNLAYGGHSWGVTVYDKAGNSRETEVSFEVVERGGGNGDESSTPTPTTTVIYDGEGWVEIGGGTEIISDEEEGGSFEADEKAAELKEGEGAQLYQLSGEGLNQVREQLISYTQVERVKGLLAEIFSPKIAPISAVLMAAGIVAVMMLSLAGLMGSLSPGLLVKGLKAIGLIPAGRVQGLVFDSQSLQGIPFAVITVSQGGGSSQSAGLGQSGSSQIAGSSQNAGSGQSGSGKGEKIMETVVTNEQGIYKGIKLLPGEYQISVNQSGYQFPSRISRPGYLSMRDFYRGESFKTQNTQNKELFLIPMDKINTEQIRSIKTITYLLSKGLLRLIQLLFYPLFIYSLVVTYLYPTTWNIILSIIYTLIVITRLYPLIKPANIKGMVTTISNRGIKNVIIRLRELGKTELSDIVQSNDQGRFKLNGKGIFQYEATKLGFMPTDPQMAIKQVDTSKANQQVQIRMKKV